MKLFDLFRRRSSSTQDIAAERLRLVLTHDRANIAPGMLEVLKDEIIAVISKHLDIDADKVVVNFTEDNRETRLMADIPVHTARSRRAEGKV
ncbi:MAG: cell division topological specificity factor MinE [Anaerolineae bacterium]|jgi:cell division topological specificity factor|nr:cell division topological specificity factor MinE [Anaerolineae bacterium]